MQAHGHLAFSLRGFHGLDDLFKRHVGRIVDLGAFLRVFEQRRVDERTGVDDDIGFPQQLCATNCDEICGSRTRTYEVNHHVSFPAQTTVSKFNDLSSMGRAPKKRPIMSYQLEANTSANYAMDVRENDGFNLHGT